LEYFFKISGLVSLLINGGLGLFVYFKNPKNHLNIRFCAFSLSIAFWSVGSSYVNLISEPSAALWALRQSYVFGSFLPALFLHFVLTFTGWQEKFRKLLVFSYLFSCILAVFALTPYFIAGAVPLKNYNYLVDSPGPFYVAFAIFFVAIVFGTLIILLFFQKKATLRQKLQLRFIFAGYLFASFAGLEYFSAVFKILKRPPLDDYSLIVTFILMSYAIVRHRLMDIEVIIKKTLVFAGLFTAAFGIFAFTTLLLPDLMSAHLSNRSTRIISVVLSTLLIIFGHDPLRKLLVRLTDHYLFQKKESFKVILNRLSQNVIATLDLEQVGKKIVETLKDSLRVESGALIIKREDSEEFYILDAFNIKREKIRYEENDFLVEFFEKHNEIVNYEEEHAKGSMPILLSSRLEELNAILCIPLLTPEGLIGILSLGKKKSDEQFSQEELEYFPALSGQVAIALSNSRYLEVLKKSRADFAQQAKMATMGTLVSGISHEIRNPLAIIRSGAEVIKFNKKTGVYDKLNKEEFEKIVLDTNEKILEAVKRADEIIKRILTFSRKPGELKIEEFPLEQAVEGAITLVSYQFSVLGVEIKKEYAPKLPPVWADKQMIEECLFNVLVNARQAMVDGGTVFIKTCRHNSGVELSIQDTGTGMSKEVIDKIFDPFFTTKDTTRNPEPTVKGTGLGLFLVREQLKSIGGRITVESVQGVGSIFHFFLPVREVSEQVSG